MKKTISILLLSLFLFNSVGYYIFFKIAQVEIKKEIKREIKLGLNVEQYQAIRFSTTEINNINWIKKGKEFLYKDQMFDIVSAKVEEGHITYYCINDRQEKELFADLELQVLKQIESNKNSKSNSSKKSIENVIKIYFYEEPLNMEFHNTSTFINTDYARSYESADLFISTPPPRF